jgi:hypothetical protein
MACLIYLGDSELGEVLAAINQIGDIYWLIAGCSQEGKGHHPIKSSKAPAVLHLSSGKEATTVESRWGQHGMNFPMIL